MKHNLRSKYVMTNRDQMHLKSYLLIENALMSQKSYLLIIIDCSILYLECSREIRRNQILNSNCINIRNLHLLVFYTSIQLLLGTYNTISALIYRFLILYTTFIYYSYSSSKDLNNTSHMLQVNKM